MTISLPSNLALTGNGRGLSTNLWDDFDAVGVFIAQNENIGYGVKPNLRSFDVAVDAAVPTVLYGSEGARGYIDTGAVIQQLPAVMGGGLRFVTDGTQYDEAWLQWGGSGGSPFMISDTLANNRELVFEAATRMTTTVSAEDIDVFVGLAEEGSAVADMIANDGGMADKDLIGFEFTTGENANWVYRKNGQAVQTPGSSWQTLVNNTWYHFGFRFDTDSDSITPWFGTGDRTTSAMNPDKTSQITSADIAAATFPDGEGLSPIIGVKNQLGVAVTLDFRLLACGQLAPAAD